VRWAALTDAADPSAFGGKAAQLAAAATARLPVPAFVALDAALVEAVATGDAAASATCARALAAVGAARVAVRSSAIGEDGTAASFAGQHATRLHVGGEAAVLAAVAEVWASARTEAALAYRRRLGIGGPVAMAVVLQAMVDADCAGVLFTRDPVDGADVRVIEATWGLGEAVVAGLVDPDRYRVRRGGAAVERHPGDKDIAIRPTGEGVAEHPVPLALRGTLCLDDTRLGALDTLAARIEAAFPDPTGHDVEWAFIGEALHLLQRRPITR
jgi:pyruvate, water dikinase